MNEMLHLPEGFSYSSFIVPRSSFASSLITHPSTFLPFRLPSAYILLLVVAVVIVACVVAVVVALSRHKKSAAKPLKLEGQVALVLEALEPEGSVLVGGELWRARARNGDRIARGQVRIVGARGHWLEVEAVAA
ncbi:MAG TPA: NfeD family protein [Pyrinomonadaceae bacterium]|nr:NfeD family protein [Pyrinomonadaceae bacterium]